MTREELRSRCEALASVGDTAAVATLELFQDFETLKKLITNAPPGYETMREKASQLGFVGVKVNGQVVDGIEPRPRAIVPPPRSLCNDPAVRDEVTTQEPTPEQSQRIGAIAKAFGIDPSGPEAGAAAATRAARWLPAVPDAGATQATTNIKTVHEKVPGGVKAEGNKD